MGIQWYHDVPCLYLDFLNLMAWWDFVDQGNLETFCAVKPRHSNTVQLQVV